MDTIVNILSRDHSHCDELLLQAELNMEKHRWELGLVMFRKFKQTLVRHLTVEETALFPALAEVMSASVPSINAMRVEHQKIMQVLRELDSAVGERDMDQFVGRAKALNLILQQHNCREEHMLYSISGQIPAAKKEQIIAAVRDVKDSV